MDLTKKNGFYYVIAVFIVFRILIDLWTGAYLEGFTWMAVVGIGTYIKIKYFWLFKRYIFILIGLYILFLFLFK
jgi:hypothetical protein